ncbi:MAG TPA: hypothetical protein VNE16_03055 [Vicinamibacterales bacterium]|nr:hypothetical protein [Vicinamibacterales bacterium]
MTRTCVSWASIPAVAVGLMLVTACSSSHTPAATATAKAGSPAADPAPRASAAPAAAPDSAPPMNDLAGYTGARDLENQTAPLTAADLDFYLQTMRAAVARAQHPSPQDLASVAAMEQGTTATVGEAKKMAVALKAGDTAAYQAAAAAMQRQQNEIRAGDKLVQFMDQVEAADRHMPEAQWSALRGRVEGVVTVGGSGGDGGEAKLSAAQMQQAARRAATAHKIEAADRALVAPHAAEVRQLGMQLIVAEAALERRAGQPKP